MSAFSITRRAVLAAATGVAAAPWAAKAAPLRRVAILGDSIAAGYGLPEDQALPARLESELARLGFAARITLVAVVGDTTAGGLARVDRAIRTRADVCVVALGGNDLLVGADPAAVRRNLEGIVGRLKARGMTVVLAGLQVPALLRGSYATAFDDAFASVARSQRVLFLPNLLEGVALNPRLNQRDGVHPNAAGVALIARRLAPVVARGLQTR